MARNEQYEYMDEGSIGPALLCIICKRPFKDPRCTPCNHIFCHECVTGRTGAYRAPCPACGKLVSADRLSSISHSLNNMLGTLRVKCKLCGLTELLRENFTDHINQSCPSARVPYSSMGIKCQWIEPRNHLHNHLPTCILHPFPSAFSVLVAENQQIKEQCQQQLSQIQKLQVKTQLQKAELKRVNQRCNEHETQIQRHKEEIERANQRCNEHETQIQRQRDEIERVNQRCSEHETQINELKKQMADIADGLSTKKFLSKEPLSSEEKIYYEECKEYFRLTGKPLISVPDEVFDDNIELPSLSIKFGIDEDCQKFDLRDFLMTFCDKLNVDINDIVVNKIQSGSAILETEISNKLGSKDKKLCIKMIYNKLTDTLQKGLAKMKIFFMFMGPIKSLFKMQKFRAEIKLNPKFNRIYARGHHYWQDANKDGIDRGNEPYYCPVGWQRQSFYVTDNFDEKFKGWCICYHGTKFSNALSILLSGLKPADRAEHGAGIYATPSINYACHPRYSEVKLIELSDQKKFFKSGKYVQFVLECRVHPDNIKKAKETLSAGSTTIDSNINNNVIEWIVDNKNKSIVDFNDPESPIVCTGLLTRTTDNHPGLLSESQWWYKSHLCNRFNCCVLGIELDSLQEQNQRGDTCNIIFN